MLRGSVGGALMLGMLRALERNELFVTHTDADTERTLRRARKYFYSERV